MFLVYGFFGFCTKIGFVNKVALALWYIRLGKRQIFPMWASDVQAWNEVSLVIVMSSHSISCKFFSDWTLEVWQL
jgi:hypothetical protein